MYEKKCNLTVTSKPAFSRFIKKNNKLKFGDKINKQELAN
jgi:hypothetical protein